MNFERFRNSPQRRGFRLHWRRILVRDEAGAHYRHESQPEYSYEQRVKDRISAVLYANRLGVRIPRSLRKYLKK